MSKKHNVFISHYGKDDQHVQRLKERLKESGYQIRNSSIDSTKYQDRVPSNKVIERYLRKGISWAGTVICLIGEKTHTRTWVNYEIKNAYLQGKKIVGIYKYGCNNSVEMPEALKRYKDAIIGWNSIDKLGGIMSENATANEKPDGSASGAIYPITRVPC